MRGVFMGEPASQPACTRTKYTSSAGMLEAFGYQCVYAPRSSDRSAVYVRKHVATMPKLQTGKLLIQNAFTSVNRTKGPVYK